MRDYHAHEIGNVAVLGHSGCGKTSIVETMAYRAGAIGQIGNTSSIISSGIGASCVCPFSNIRPSIFATLT